MSLASTAWLRACAAAVLLLGSCRTTANPATPGALEVQFIETRTVNSVDDDPELVGPKRVSIQINIFRPLTVDNIVMSYWPAGNNAGSQSVEKTVGQSFTPPTGGIASGHAFDIPGSELYEQCEGLYYMFAVGYHLENGAGGLYITQPGLILPTKKRLSNGTIQQALCAEPPGPGE